MISGSINDVNKYDMDAPAFKTAFAFLRRNDLAELPEGWVELEHGVRASVQHYTTAPARELKFETHERYFDIQFIVKGEEWLGCVSRAGMSVETPYNAVNDVTFYKTPQVSGGVYLRAGEYAVFAPEDAHQPRCIGLEATPVIKIVVKVPV